METIEDFIKRFSRDVGCYYHRNKVPREYPIKKNDTMEDKKMGVFGFIMVLREQFRIRTNLEFVRKSDSRHLFDGERENLWWTKPDAYLFVNKESSGDDYQKAVKALNSVKDII